MPFSIEDFARLCVQENVYCFRVMLIRPAVFCAGLRRKTMSRTFSILITWCKPQWYGILHVNCIVQYCLLGRNIHFCAKVVPPSPHFFVFCYENEK